MKLLVGLGNPGRKYAKARHNLGFMVANLLAGKFKIKAEEKKFSSFFGIGRIGDIDVCIIKPQTFMNLSGEAVLSFVNYYKVGTGDLLVMHDDLDIVLGKVKFAFDAGDGGHNGVSSIIEWLATREFWQLKMGIGRPPEKVDPADFVLGKFMKEEQSLVEKVIQTSAEAVYEFVTAGPEKAMQKYHSLVIT